MANRDEGEDKGGGASGGKFDLQTGQGSRAGGAAAPYQQRQLPQQRRNPAEELGPAAGIPAGGKDLRADAKPGNPSSADVGAGSIGNATKPFRLGGAK